MDIQEIEKKKWHLGTIIDNKASEIFFGSRDHLDYYIGAISCF